MSEAKKDTMTEAITVAVTDAIQKRDRETSERHERAKAQELVMERAAKKLLSIRDIVMAIGFFVALIGGATMAFSQLQDKPSKSEMVTAIDSKVEPVKRRVEPMESSVKILTSNVERIQQIQEIQMQHAEWRADVADCRARASCKRAPNEPQSLKDKRRELMTQRAQ